MPDQTKPDRLTLEELSRVERTVRRRLNLSEVPGFLGLGFGSAVKEGRLDEDRPHAIQVWFSRKKQPRSIPKKHRLPREVTVRLLRDGHFQQLTFPIDVIDASEVVPTAAYYQDTQVLTNVLMRYKPTGSPPAWGQLTCQHGFRKPFEGDTTFKGTASHPFLSLHWRSNHNHYTDAALVELPQSEALAFHQISHPEDAALPTTAIGLRTDDELISDTATKSTGRTHGASEDIIFAAFQIGPIRVVQDFFRLKYVLMAIATRDNVFRPGTSGCLWTIDNQIAAIQVAAHAPDFRIGYAVTVDSIFRAIPHSRKAVTALL